MFIAMNRFKVRKDAAQEFENLWLTRESYLHELEGFIEFHMLRGPEREDHVLYSSHTLWTSKAHFEAWTRSDQFRASHTRATTSTNKPLTLGHPEFEGFEVIQTIGPMSKAAE
ncbi:heme-degrading monooxygenase HmoA [Microvirga flocculans]|uniref:Heme-degrading monooxygenase HmoA n=1 Tax=Microvirga flocculans TaxID=217168 RepID=A0A7W6ICC9_9HYPH|nr:antibiotic biosynthesis monooxygenase [Microvirga flocculans]MBB4038810.1 heme-degrading monooxygenase HmoA [Microvirga flocculans]